MSAGGHLDNQSAGYHALFTSNTYDIYMTWWSLNSTAHRWFDVAGFRLNQWSHLLVTPPVDLNVRAPAVFNPTGQPSNDILYMSVVSAISKAQASDQPMVLVEWPVATDLNPPPEYFTHCPEPTTTILGPPGIAWHAAVSYNYGKTWSALRDSHPNAQVPLCVGANSLVVPGYATYRNSFRSSLAFDPNSNTIIDAIAMWDTFDNVPGTYIEANGFSTYATTPSPLPIFHTTHVDTQARQDQFLPVVSSALGTGGPQGYVTIAWLDSVEDTTGSNVPTGVYGVTSQGFTINTPGWSTTMRAWPVPPAAHAYMFNGFPDTLGRHNSMSVQGWSWVTFAGDYASLGHETMDMTTISPL